MKISENLTAFCFQGVEKGCTWNEWVNLRKTVRKLVRNHGYRSKNILPLQRIWCEKNPSFFERYINHGLNDKVTQNLRNKDKSPRQRNTRFRNKLVLGNIRAKDDQTRNQTDLLDMRAKGTVTFKGKQHRYILTVEAVFSYFVWLRPLKVKSNLLVYEELKKLCHEHGPLYFNSIKENTLTVWLKDQNNISVSRSFAAVHTTPNHKAR